MSLAYIRVYSLRPSNVKRTQMEANGTKKGRDLHEFVQYSTWSKPFLLQKVFQWCETFCNSVQLMNTPHMLCARVHSVQSILRCVVVCTERHVSPKRWALFLNGGKFITEIIDDLRTKTEANRAKSLPLSFRLWNVLHQNLQNEYAPAVEVRLLQFGGCGEVWPDQYRCDHFEITKLMQPSVGTQSPFGWP